MVHYAQKNMVVKVLIYTYRFSSTDGQLKQTFLGLQHSLMGLEFSLVA